MGRRSHVDIVLETAKIRHVQRISTSGRVTGVVHALESEGKTYCSWVFLSNQTHNGRRISFAADTAAPLDCKKCGDVMRMVVDEKLRELPPAEIEKILETM